MKIEIDIDMELFSKEFNANYEYLYNSDNDIPQYYELMDMFDMLSGKNEMFTKLVTEFIKYRQDYITSDREAVAFMITLLEYNGTDESIQCIAF